MQKMGFASRFRWLLGREPFGIDDFAYRSDRTGQGKSALAVGVNCHRGLDDDCAPAAEVGEHVAGLLED
jgi:hypothetical protein